MKLWQAKFMVPLPEGGHRMDEELFYVSSDRDVRRILRDRGLFPIRIRERREALITFNNVRTKRWQMQLLKALRFQAGRVSAGTALLEIAESESDRERQVAFLPCRSVLKSGGSFSAAVKSLRLFDAATLAILMAGDKTGNLKDVIDHALQHIEQKAKQARVLYTALGWLAFDIISVLGSLVSMHFWYIPFLRETGVQTSDPQKKAEFVEKLNLAENINMGLMGLSFAICALGIYLATAFWVNRDKRDHFAARIIKKVPLIGSYLSLSSLTDSGMTVARLLRGRVPLDEALKIAKDASLALEIREYWTTCLARVHAGVKPQSALAAPPLKKVEQNQLKSFTTMDQLAEVYEAIAEEKQYEAKSVQRRIVIGGIMLLGGVFGAVVMLMLWLVFLQNEGILSMTQTAM